MSFHKIQIEYEWLSNGDSFDTQDKQLVDAAKEAVQGSYAPYSHFHVGASVLLEDGTIVKGSNQENVAYPSGLCAERVAIFAASSQYPDKIIKSIAITAHSKDIHVVHPLTPCGACRQVISEYEDKQGEKISILLADANGDVIKLKSSIDLLPLMFKADHLKK